MTIEAGASVIERVGFLSMSPDTVVDQGHPATATGLIFQVQIWCWGGSGGGGTGVEVASFTASGDVLTTRDYAALPNCSAGLNTFNAPTDFTPFGIALGDYTGVSFTGKLAAGPVPGNNYWLKSGDNIPCTSVEFALQEDWEFSLYVTGYQLGQINIGDAWKDIVSIDINIGDVWKRLCDLNLNVGDDWKETLY